MVRKEKNLSFKLVTPDREVVNESVLSVTLPSSTGQITILPGHAMLVSGLSEGKLRYVKLDKDDAEKTIHYDIGSGFVEVYKSIVTVLADSANLLNQ